MEYKLIKTSKIKPNQGQIDGLPKNPRRLTSFKKDELKKSIIESPEFLEIKMIIVYPFGDEFITIAGNARLMVCKELKFKEMPCIVLPVETPVEKLKEYAIKENLNVGQWDWNELTENWPSANEWGLWETEPKPEAKEGTQDVSFKASTAIILTVELETLAQQEVLHSKLQSEGYNCWFGKRKPKN